MTSERPYEEIGERLRNIRYSIAKQTLQDFASSIDVNYSTYHLWERGHRRISIENALKIADKFGVSIDYIFTGRTLTLRPDQINRLGIKGDENIDPRESVEFDLRLLSDDELNSVKQYIHFLIASRDPE